METGASKVFNFEGEGTKSPRCKRVNSPPLKIHTRRVKTYIIGVLCPKLYIFLPNFKGIFFGVGGISIKKFRVHTHLDLLV